MKRFALVLALAALVAIPTFAQDTPKSCCAGMEGVTKQVTNLDNGIQVTMTAKDAKLVAKLQECAGGEKEGCCKDCQMHDKGVTRKVEKTADGFVMTATATDPALIKKLQEHATNKGCSHTTAAKDGKSCPHHADGAKQGTSASTGKACPMGGEGHSQTASAGHSCKKSCSKEEGAKACAKPATPAATETK